LNLKNNKFKYRENINIICKKDINFSVNLKGTKLILTKIKTKLNKNNEYRD